MAKIQNIGREAFEGLKFKNLKAVDDKEIRKSIFDDLVKEMKERSADAKAKED